MRWDGASVALCQFPHSTSCDILAAKLLLNIFDDELNMRDNDMNDNVPILTSDKCSHSPLHNESLAQEVDVDQDGYKTIVIHTSNMMLSRSAQLMKNALNSSMCSPRFQLSSMENLKKYTGCQFLLELKPDAIPTCSCAYPGHNSQFSRKNWNTFLNWAIRKAKCSE